MTIHPLNRRQFGLLSMATAVGAITGSGAKAAAPSTIIVPGTGKRVANTGDDFEEENWQYSPQLPKSSWNLDKDIRVPGGISTNRQWVEAAKRGQPDVIKRVETPPGGLEGSKGSMLIQSLHTGVPGRFSYEDQQDDLLHNVAEKVGGEMSVGLTPNCVCRVYIPASSQWERRNGSSFGYRLGLRGITPRGETEEYWPGLFLIMTREKDKDGKQHDYVRTSVRADGWGRDLSGPAFEPATWCTMGMTTTPDGAVQFFAKAGTDDLTEKDHLGTYHCYSYRATRFQTFFYNVINRDDGRNWSTPWVIDQAMLYVATPNAAQTATGAARGFYRG